MTVPGVHPTVYRSRDLVGPFEVVEVTASDGIGGVTKGTMGELFRRAAFQLDMRETDGFVFVGLGWESNDDEALLRLFFEDDRRPEAST